MLKVAHQPPTAVCHVGAILVKTYKGKKSNEARELLTRDIMKELGITIAQIKVLLVDMTVIIHNPNNDIEIMEKLATNMRSIGFKVKKMNGYYFFNIYKPSLLPEEILKNAMFTDFVQGNLPESYTPPAPTYENAPGYQEMGGRKTRRKKRGDTTRGGRCGVM